jgi:hypothetical protein
MTLKFGSDDNEDEDEAGRKKGKRKKATTKI